MDAALPCPFCGQPEHVSVLEIWTGGEFMLETCCEGLHEALVFAFDSDPEFAKVQLRALTDGLTPWRLRRPIVHEQQYLLDWHLDVRPIRQAAARAFIARHHAHAPKAPAGWRFGGGIYNGPDLIAVIWAGRPVARNIDQRAVIEVNRLCVRRDVPPPLVWNACSLAYGWAARRARTLGAERIITYTLASEDGTALRAAGWQPDGQGRGGTWDRPSRRRDYQGPTEQKLRWCRDLRPGRRLAG